MEAKSKKRSRNPSAWQKNRIKRNKVRGLVHQTYSGDMIAAKESRKEDLDARESHYSRENNRNRVFLDSNKTVSGLFKEFLQVYPQHNQPDSPYIVKRWVFEKVFNFQYNIGFGFPRSDLCETCEKLHTKITATDASEEEALFQLCTEQQEHWHDAEAFYGAMKKEVVQNLSAEEQCICFDFQKNLPLPVTNVTAEYFLSQLWLYNFCIHDMKTNKATMFLYTENFAGKGSNETTSCIKYYIEHILPSNSKKLYIFCDNSFAQNKNRFMYLVLQAICERKGIEIIMKYPIPGHSRLRCDANFGHIEKKRKLADKFSFPSDYVNLIKSAQENDEFQIVFVEHPLTDDLADDGTPIVTVQDYKNSLSPLINRNAGISRIRQLKISAYQIEYCPTTYGTLFTPLNLLKTGVLGFLARNAVWNAPKAYTNFLPIAQKKFENVFKLLEFIVVPPGKIFYESLRSAAAEETSDEEEDDYQQLQLVALGM